MDEDFFSDDATLDALPEYELQALEDAAVKSTQHPVQSQFQLQSQQQQHRQQQYKYYRNGRVQPPQLPVGPPLQRQQARYQQRQTEYQRPKTSDYQTLPYTHRVQSQLQGTHQYIPAPAPLDNLPSSDDYGGFDETTELWDSVAPEAQPQDQQHYAERDDDDRGQDMDAYVGGQQYADDVIHEDDRVNLVGGEMMGVEAGTGVEYYQETGGVYKQPEQQQQDPTDLRLLIAKITELEDERERLQQRLRDAHSDITSRSGEIAIVRSNIIKSEREHQHIIASMRDLQAEEREKHKREIEEIRTESERMKTEMVFLRKEVEDVAKQNRNLVKSKRQQTIAVGTGENGDYHMLGGMSTRNSASCKSLVTTPRKSKGYAFRDGFEDEEMLSPSKVGKNRTPTKAGTKRKRSTIDSPQMALSITQPKRTPVDPKPIQVVDEALLDMLWKEEDRFDFFKAVVAHRPTPGAERTLEALTKFTFPSSPQTTLSSVFHDKITLLQSTAAESEFSAGVCKVLLSIWSRCLQENSYGALNLILGLLQFSIVWDQGSTCYKFFEETVDLVQQTVDINAIPMLRRNLANLEDDVDVDVCLRLLEGIILGLSGNEKHTKRFWKCIRSDFPLMMLNLNQPLRHIQLMASILSTSCLGDSFGPLSSSETDQRANEGNLLEAATKILADSPKPIAGGPEYSRMQIAELRKEVLQFLGGVAGMEIGTAALAIHPNALPRLIKRIAEELEETYELKFGRDQSVQLVNLAVRIIHGILTIHPSESTPKLAGPSTRHKHLVAMTRLAFSEGCVQEHGIEDGVIDSATKLLESMITMEEAHSLDALFHS